MIKARIAPNTLSRLVEDGYDSGEKNALSINTSKKILHNKAGKVSARGYRQCPNSPLACKSPVSPVKTNEMLISVLGSTPLEKSVSLDVSRSKVVISGQTVIHLDERAQIQITPKGFSILYYDRVLSKPSFARFKYLDSNTDGDDWGFKIQSLVKEARFKMKSRGTGDGVLEKVGKSVDHAQVLRSLFPPSPPTSAESLSTPKPKDFWIRDCS